MKSHELIAAYIKLSPEQRHEFDRLYAERVRLLRVVAKLRKATPEQLRCVREFLERCPRRQRFGCTPM
jgi:hypothetical protein